ncbi:ABC transporter ATP-binding protein [Burkholderia cepacia]|uniref:ABC transporter ATP-binding protein n=1 Tax=Burkholderia TaxID=32008 RepID=UPI002AB5EFA6|nr:ABC transporter ATP-binding protein [Burkholderia cepacia]
MTFKRLLWWWKRHRLKSFIGICALVIAHLFEAGISGVLREGVDRLAHGRIDIKGIVLILTLLSIAKYACLSFGRRVNARISVEMARDLRADMYAHLQNLDFFFYEKHKIGDLIARSTGDIESIKTFFRYSSNQFTSLVAVTIIAPIFMANLSVRLAVCIFPMFVVTVVGVWWLTRMIREQTASVKIATGDLSESVLQNLRGIRTIQAHCQEEREVAYFAKQSQAYAGMNVELNRLQSHLNNFTFVIAALMGLIVAMVGGSEVLLGRMSVGTLSAFIFYLTMIMGVYGRCSTPVFAYLSAAAAAVRIFHVLDQKPRLTDQGRDGLTGDVKGHLLLRDVSFKYSESEKSRYVLDKVSLEVSAGEFVVIVGRVGAGKTALLRSLTRLNEPQLGCIELDGQAITEYSLRDLRNAVVLVAQDSHVFAATLRENIAYHDPDRNDDDVWQAARISDLEATILNMDAGLSTLVGERGVTLSGGQRQRAVLARGVIRKSPVLLLDDTFSALDAKTESTVLSALKAARHSLTTVIVSHRPSAAQYADRVILMDHGRIVGCASHEDLLTTSQLYRSLCGLENPPRDGVVRSELQVG